MEDELLELKARFEKLDNMDDNDPKFNEEEYEALEEVIELKDNLVVDLRSKLQTAEMVKESYEYTQ